MDLNRSWVRVLAGACALTFLVAACGDDDDSADTSDDTEETTASTEAPDDSTESTEADETTASEPEEETTTSEADDEGDPEAVAVAEAINLTIGDFAEGWVEQEPADEGDDDIDQCFTTVDIEASTLGEAETPSFSAETPDGQGGQAVSMQTVVFDTPDTATAVLSDVATEEFAACAQGILAEDSAEGTAVALAPTIDDPPLAEESVGVAGAIEIPGPDGTVQPAEVDLHAIRTGSVVSFTFTLDIGETPESGFQQTLAELYTVIAARQAAEVG
ncbi:MAG TPA: hypothetical protein VK507_09365 [Iamia sp.]|nr:hypothetical protein [Iamia sp.]